VAPSPTEVNEVVTKYFTVTEWKVQHGVLTYVIRDEDTKERFVKLYFELDEKGYIPVLRSEDCKRVLRVFRRREPPRRNPIWNVVLLLVTTATVALAGYLFTMEEVYNIVDSTFSEQKVLHLLAYVASIFFVLGVHELGHKIACKKHNLRSTPPYFIPGPPMIGGSLGAVMIQETPVLNRDQLFDVGLLGPLLGFMASILITFLGLSLSYVIPIEVAQSLSEQGLASPLPVEPLLFTFIWIRIVVPLLQIGPDQTILMHPVAFAGWIGMLVTFLNTLPAGQLDGGHVVRAALGSKRHVIASIIAIAIMVMTGFVMMAVLALVILIVRPHSGPLDDVSPLSRSRKVLFPLLLIICGLCYTSLFNFVVF
jgi:membrane-associated protease RseP (regulator of RpoE activity)